MNQYFIYTDASFNKNFQTGVAGFFIFNSTAEHEKGLDSIASIPTITFTEKNNIRAEIRGALYALEFFEKKIEEKDFSLTLYTDCQTISHLLERREKLESTHYISKQKKAVLANADIYKAFFLIYDRLRPEIVWVKGHVSSENQTAIQKNFSFIDKAVREKLRSLILQPTHETFPER